MALPNALGDCAAAVGLEQGKDMDGRALMLRMARPRSYDPVYGTPVWWDEPEKIARLAAYCQQDVRVEQAIAARIVRLPATELLVWLLTEEMNDRGVLLDIETVKGARRVTERAVRAIEQEMSDLSNGLLRSINKPGVIADWLRWRGLELEDLTKATVRDLLKADDLGPDVRRIIELRQEGAKASTAKLKTFLGRADADKRMRGNLLYHGASTGRWSHPGGQLGNTPRETVKDPELAAAMLRDEDYEGLRWVYGKVLPMVSTALRPMIVAAPGHELLIADYAAVEARGTAWLAGQQDLLDAFADGVDIYCDMGSSVFNREVTKADVLGRFVGKQLILGCGYQMGWERFIEHCATVGDVEISDELAQASVGAYRERYPAIPALWRELQDACFDCVTRRVPTTAANGRVRFQMSGSFLICTIPSGRHLFFPFARIARVIPPWAKDMTPEEKEAERRPAVVYRSAYGGGWVWTALYGGLLTENIVQALCRDLLAAALIRMRRDRWHPTLTVHDEIVSEEPAGRRSVGELVEVMTEMPAWAAGMPVKAEGWRATRYGKG